MKKIKLFNFLELEKNDLYIGKRCKIKSGQTFCVEVAHCDNFGEEGFVFHNLVFNTKKRTLKQSSLELRYWDEYNLPDYLEVDEWYELEFIPKLKAIRERAFLDEVMHSMEEDMEKGVKRL